MFLFQCFLVLFWSFALTCHVLLFVSSLCVNLPASFFFVHLCLVCNQPLCVCVSLSVPCFTCVSPVTHLCYFLSLPVSPCGMFHVFWLFFVPGFAFLFVPVLTDLSFALVWYFVLAFVLLHCIFGILHLVFGLYIYIYIFHFDCLLKLPCILHLCPHKCPLLQEPILSELFCKISCLNVFTALMCVKIKSSRFYLTWGFALQELVCNLFNVISCILSGPWFCNDILNFDLQTF